jgi:hypothetical protein
MDSASDTSPVALGESRAGRPSSSVPMRSSLAAARDAIVATARSSPACAQEATLR